MVTLGKSREILEKTSREISEATPTKFLRSNSDFFFFGTPEKVQIWEKSQNEPLLKS